MILTESLDLTEKIETSKTYSDNGESILSTKIDGLEAVKMSILKRLTTEQYDCPLYSFEYGIQTYDLIGKDADYVIPELKRRITESLLKDERITAVSNFAYNQTGDSILITFNVATIYGDVSASKEVQDVRG